jgi:multicomponent Na+:H+ antiporter subunit C
MGIAIYVMAFAFLLLGLYALVAKKNIVRIIIGIAIVQYSVNLLLVLMGYRKGGMPPIVTEAGHAVAAGPPVDPLPQAMVLASIIIGLGITALAVGLAIRLYEKYGTFDLNDIRKLRG